MSTPTVPGARPAREIVDPLPIEVPRPMVLIRLGYRHTSQIPEKTSLMIDEVIGRGRALLSPKAIYGVVGVSTPDPGVTEIAGAIRSSSGSLRERLGGCARAVVFAATVGPGVEVWGRELMDSGEMTRGLLADAFASSAAITLGLEVEKIAGRRLAEEGLSATRRYAPGYGDWDLADQTPLLSLLDAGRIGITLTEDHLMIPTKSISGIIGGR